MWGWCFLSTTAALGLKRALLYVQVWAVPPKEMQCEWLGERVATVDVDRAITNVIHNKEDAGWGPNAVFRFPLEGGTGGIWKGVAKLLPQSHQVCSPSWWNMFLPQSAVIILRWSE